MNATRMQARAAGATALLKALANSHRLIILCHLAEGEKSVGELEALLGMRQPHLSQHLARLRRDALVGTRRDSRTIYYRLGSAAAAKMIRLLYALYCSPRRASRPTRPRRRGHAPALAAAARGDRRR